MSAKRWLDSSFSCKAYRYFGVILFPLILVHYPCSALHELVAKDTHQRFRIHIDSISEPMVLDASWLYHKGDNMEWASPAFDDSKWDTLSTRLNMKQVGADKFNRKGWFRLHITIDSTLFNKSYALMIDQMGASEIFFNGIKIAEQGKIPNDTIQEERYNPKLLPMTIQFGDSTHQLIAIRYFNAKSHAYSQRYYHHDAGFTATLAEHEAAIFHIKYFIVSNYFFLGLIMIFMILGFIHILFFLFYPKKVSNLYYAIFLFLFSLLVYAGKLQNAIDLDPDIQVKIAFYSSLLIPFFFIALLGFIYSLFYLKTPVLFWVSAALGVGVSFLYLMNLNISNYFLLGFAILVPLEVIRVLILAILQRKDGAWIIGVGVVLFAVFFLVLLAIGVIYGNISISSTGPLQIIFLSLVLLAVLSTPFSMSIYLARDIAKTNQNLEKQLEQVQVLSAKTLEQEREKKRILENQKERLEILVKERTNELEVEKQKTEELLLNTLPLKVVNDLKENGKTQPESFEDVTVYFSDIVGFTKLSSELEPEVLINELNDIFTAFDDIMSLHQCERIKTIGDAYLAVCGMPEKNDQHARKMLNAAIEIRNYLEKRNQESYIQWKIRIGIHSGKVVGGIVGIRKYIYDVFGDTINTTSRMENYSEPMKINVSEPTYELVKNDFKFKERSPMEIKGLGKTKMYFLEGE